MIGCIIAAIVLTYVVLRYLLLPLPFDFAQCTTFHNNDYTINNMWCTYSPSSLTQAIQCKSAGADHGVAGCFVVYYNEKVTWPQNYEQCTNLVGPTYNYCDISVDTINAYNKTVAKKLYDQCTQNPHALLFGNQCSVRFENN